LKVEVGKNLVEKTFSDFEAGCGFIRSVSCRQFSSMQICQSYNSWAV